MQYFGIFPTPQIIWISFSSFCFGSLSVTYCERWVWDYCYTVSHIKHIELYDTISSGDDDDEGFSCSLLDEASLFVVALRSNVFSAQMKSFIAHYRSTFTNNASSRWWSRNFTSITQLKYRTVPNVGFIFNTWITRCARLGSQQYQFNSSIDLRRWAV